MEDHSAEFRRCLTDLDVDAAQRLWAHVAPHLYQPTTREQTLVMLHNARTQAASVPLKLRAYSHRWLLDRGYPSGLPDELKPSAERIYPKVVQAVGISVNTKSAILKPITELVRGAMEDVVREHAAEGELGDTALVKARMFEAKDKITKQLVGSLRNGR